MKDPQVPFKIVREKEKKKEKREESLWKNFNMESFDGRLLILAKTLGVSFPEPGLTVSLADAHIRMSLPSGHCPRVKG